ncbi:MAG TPA: YggT family protein [Tahibacter sp.]|uniref:YggT family protein n=1 Tax=Tahibacter sp. TaxID=2056211 RepID=UPI002C56CE70|nr:YggT family protein [Tahibacter sp.]HSX60310.1 YggT family protein [Tahibacter sp.]
MGFFRDAGLMLVQIFFSMVMLVFALRLLLPLTRVRFNNPLCQFIYKVTNPVVGPLSQLVPPVRQVSLATVLVLWLIALLQTALMFLLVGYPLRIGELLLTGTAVTIYFLLGIAFWGILFSAIASFFSPDRRNPAVEVLFGLTEPLLRPFRKWPPRLEHFDLSPLYASIVLRLTMLALTHLLGALRVFLPPL